MIATIRVFTDDDTRTPRDLPAETLSHAWESGPGFWGPRAWPLTYQAGRLVRLAGADENLRVETWEARSERMEAGWTEACDALAAETLALQVAREDLRRWQAATGADTPEMLTEVMALTRGGASPIVAARRVAETAAAVEIEAAIRVFTVDMPNGAPNGEAEKRLAALGPAIGIGGCVVTIGEARAHYRAYCNAMADNLMRLRTAADAYFGGDFNAPLPMGDDAKEPTS